MKTISRKTVAILLLALLAVLPFASGTVAIEGDTVITETLDIANARQNLSGPGYSWANRYDELTLSGLNLYTPEPYGLRLPNNCTVILEGRNYINAEKYGIACSGTVVFKGSGSLYINAGETGILIVSQNNTHKIRLLEGSYEIHAGTYGIYSEASDFSFVGKDMSIDVRNPEGYAIWGRCVNLLGGTFSAKAPVYTTNELVVDNLDISITNNTSGLPALSSAHTLRVQNIKFDGIAEYSGEENITGKGTGRFFSHSIIFGESVPAFIDYIVIAALVIIIGLAVAIPVIRKKKKSKKINEELRKQGLVK